MALCSASFVSPQATQGMLFGPTPMKGSSWLSPAELTICASFQPTAAVRFEKKVSYRQKPVLSQVRCDQTAQNVSSGATVTFVFMHLVPPSERAASPSQTPLIFDLAKQTPASAQNPTVILPLESMATEGSQAPESLTCSAACQPLRAGSYTRI